MITFVKNTIATGQKRDCTIRAIASLCDVAYETAELTLALAGKDDNRGFNIYKWLDDNDGHVLGCKFTLVRRLEKVGRYMIGNNRHVRAYIDNVCHDYSDRGMSYRYCYKVELNAGDDSTLRRLAILQTKGITTLEQWKPTRRSIIDNL